MNKSELVASMAEKSGLTKADCARAVEAFTDAVGDAISSGDSLSLVGFGTFSVRDRAARLGRNPRTGEEIQISAAKMPTFKPGKALKDLANA